MNALGRVAGLWIPLIRPAELNPRHHFQQNHTNCKLCASTSTNLCDYRAAKQLLGVNSSISGFKCARRPTCNHLQVKPHHHLASEPQNLNTRGSIVIRVYPAIILGRHNHIRMHFAPCQTLSLYLSSALQLHNNARKLLRNFRRVA